MTGNELKKIRVQLKETQTQFYVIRLGYATQVHGSRLEKFGKKQISNRAEKRISDVLQVFNLLNTVKK